MGMCSPPKAKPRRAAPGSGARRTPLPVRRRCRRPAGWRGHGRPRGADRAWAFPRFRWPIRESPPRPRRPLAENRRAAGDRLEIGDVADADSGDVGESFHACALAARNTVAPRLYGSIGVRGTTCLLDLLKEPVLAVQEFFLLAGQRLPQHLPQTALLRRHHPADGCHRRGQPGGGGAGGPVFRHRDGAADGARPGAIRGRWNRPEPWWRSRWRASWARC